MAGMMKVLVWASCISLAYAFTFEYVSEVRQNFDEKSNSDLNGQMAAFQRASLVYMAYASFFGRASVNLPGFRQFFQSASEASRKDAQTVLDYINIRGGHQQFVLLDMTVACGMMRAEGSSSTQPTLPQICQFVLKKDPTVSLKKKKSKFSRYMSLFQTQTDEPSFDDWQTGVMGLSDALLMERALNTQLLDLVTGATRRGDRHLRHTMEDAFLGQQTTRIKRLGNLLTKLRQYSPEDYPLGEYAIDFEMGP